MRVGYNSNFLCMLEICSDLYTCCLVGMWGQLNIRRDVYSVYMMVVVNHVDGTDILDVWSNGTRAHHAIEW